MAYTFDDTTIGLQPIDETSTTKNHPLGTIKRASDPTYGSGEFIYLLGIGSTVVGSTVTYNDKTWVTALTTNTTYQATPVAVAMSANVASQYGWYQIAGNAVVKKVATKVIGKVKVYLSGATQGRVTPTASIGTALLGAKVATTANVTVTSTTSTIVLTINRPHAQGPDNVTTAGA